MINYWAYWIIDGVRSNLATWIIGVVAAAAGAGAKSIGSWLWHRYKCWRERREQVAEIKEWKRSLSVRNLSVMRGRFVGKPRSKVLSGSLREGVRSRKDAPIVACSHTKGNRGPSGPWGTNVLLKAARADWGVSLPVAAERLNVTVQELGRWERGDCRPTRKMLMRLKRGYGKSAEELGYGDLEEMFVSQYTSKVKHSKQAVEISGNDKGCVQVEQVAKGSAERVAKESAERSTERPVERMANGPVERPVERSTERMAKGPVEQAAKHGHKNSAVAVSTKRSVAGRKKRRSDRK